MAKEAPAVEASETPPPAPSRKKKILILAIIALLVIGLAGAGALLVLKKKGKGGEGQSEEEVVAHEEKEKEKKGPPVFSKLDTFTVNLTQENNADQYLQVAITLEIENAETDAALKASMPKVRDSIIRLLSGKKPSELTSSDGKDALAGELMDALNILLAGEQADAPKKGKKKRKQIEGPVVSVLFTDFIIQ